ncbi:MAG TPA: hypothetical protein VF937_03165 [Chloroflexota bacterium]
MVIGALLALSVLVSACGSGSGTPSTPGQYSVQHGSVHFDGDRYQLYWADASGGLHHLDTRNLRLVRDPNQTLLEVPQSGDPILHLREDEPITVEGRDNQGAFSSPWFPFLLGATLGNAFGGGRGSQPIVINNPAPGERASYDASTPAYRYPPTGNFGRDDELHGSLDTSKPQMPDYTRVQPAPYATTGKASGTGGGLAASNKSVGATNATSGQSAGTGSGLAATHKSLGGGGSGAISGKPSTSIGGGSRAPGGARAPSVGRH